MTRRLAAVFVLLVVALSAGGCARQGEVTQGRCVAFNPDRGTVTLLISAGRRDTSYTRLPPVTFALPSDERCMGPAPAAGLLVRVNPQAKTLLVYDPMRRTIETVACASLQLSDPPTRGERALPEIDREKRTVTTLAGDMGKLATFSLSEKDLSRPPASWIMGDVVRIYSQETGKAVRLMNVSKTKI